MKKSNPDRPLAVTQGLVEAMSRLPRDRKAEAQRVHVKKQLLNGMSRMPKNLVE